MVVGFEYLENDKGYFVINGKRLKFTHNELNILKEIIMTSVEYLECAHNAIEFIYERYMN